MLKLGRFALVAIALFFSGCVVNQSIKMDYQPAPASAEKLGINVQVMSKDQRDFVLDGRKQPNYIGHYRAGLGNTWDVTTANKLPLAENLQDDVSNDLVALGFDVVTSGATRVLKIDILDWNFDTYMNGKIWYKIHVSVESNNGATLASSDLEDTVVIQGSVWTGAKSAFEREVPKVYQQVVGNIARNNQEIMAALKSP